MLPRILDHIAELSREAIRVLYVRHELPISTLEDVRGVAGLEDEVLYAAEEEIGAANLLAGDMMGWGCPAVERKYLLPGALQLLHDAGPTWHDEGNRCYLLSRLPLVQAFYSLIASVRGLGSFQGYQWISGLGLDANVWFEGGWLALLWSGPLEKESVLQERVGKLWRDFRVLAATDELPWPAMVCFVVADEWQAELVGRVLRRLGWPAENFSVWCLKDMAGNMRDGEVWTGRWEFPEINVVLPSRGQIYQPVRRRDIGGWSWQRRLQQSPWATGDVPLATVIEELAEWRRINPAWVKEAHAKSVGAREWQRALSSAIGLGLAEKEEKRGREVWYTPTNPAYALLSRRDGVQSPSPKPIAERLLHHHTTLTSLAADAKGKGIPIAFGDRNNEDMGEAGGEIAPDAMLLFDQSPWGRTWANLEVEFSARGEQRVRRKFRSHASTGLRQDENPVLALSKSDKTEEVFQRVAREFGLRMLTATEGRLKTHGLLGCWSLNGEIVSLAEVPDC